MNKKQLWDSLLQQAISGKLVPQLDSEPAVEQIGPAPASDDVPFKLPEKWKWVRLGGLIRYISGTAYQKNDVSKSSNNSIRILRGGNIGKYGEIFLQDDDVFVTKELQDNFCRVCAGDVVIVASTGSATAIGRAGCATIDFDAQIGAFLRIIRTIQLDVLEPKYLHAFFLSSVYKQNIQSVVQGTNIKNVKRAYIDNMLLPLPPLEEQRRIVAKLDELKPLVDQFGEAYDKLSELEADFPRKLKASILQAAMQGKLVPQLDTEPAVEQIGPAPAPDEVLFKLPEKWKWVQAKYMGSWKSGATPRRDNAEFWKNGTVPWLKTGEVSNGLVLATEEFVTEKAVKQARLRLNPEGSVLIAMYGTGTVGNIGILGIPCTTNQACCACITDSYVVINWFLFYVLIAFRALLINKAAGTTNLQNLSKDKIEKIWVPLPPLEEQRRIVERIEQLFAEVDKMSACKAP